jgi:hypothetical protein
MKPWQWAVILAEAVLLSGVLGALAWLLLFHAPALEPQVAVQAQLAPATTTPTETPTTFVWPTLLPSRTPQPTNTRVVSRERLNQETIDQIERQVRLVRGLEPRATVPVQFLTRDEMLAYVRQSYAADQSTLDKQVALYRALGLMSSEARLDPDAIVRSVAGSIAGFYDPQAKSLRVISDLENLGADEKVTLAHEYTHALQDQQFNLAQITSRVTTTDMRLALSSLYEGDATTVMAIYLYGNTTQSEWDYLAYRASFADRSVITATGVSTRTSQIEYLPYRQGAQFIVRLWLDGRGWAQVNHAYAEPPPSTSIVLHPERYLTQHATPVPVALPDLAPVLGREWTPTIKLDTLGEFMISVHLDEFLNDPRRAAQAAEGWLGDSLTLWTASGERQAFAWSIVWDTPRDAGEFFEACSALLRQRVGAGLTVERQDAAVRWYSGRAGSGLIQAGRTGDQSLVLWGPDIATVQRLLAAFK